MEGGSGRERGRTKGGERLSVKASQCSDFNGSCQARGVTSGRSDDR